MRLPPHPAAGQFNSWLSLWVLVALLGQALLPTLAFERSGSAPELWNEICSVVGVRQSPIPVQNTPASKHHADCPLCLQPVHGVIADSGAASPLALFYLFNQISSAVLGQPITKIRTALPEARAPPEFN